MRVVHYVNQFFSGIGGEEKAHIEPFKMDELPPISQNLQKNLSKEDPNYEVVGTIACGDSYFNENLDIAKPKIIEMIKELKPDLFVAGPAFNAGRYGVACGTIAKEVEETLGIKVLTAMYEENPGADMFKKDVYILQTKDSAAGMRKALPLVAKFLVKLGNNEEIKSPQEEGYMPRGMRVNYFAEDRGSKRSVNMLVKKLKGEDFVTEYPMPNFDRVEPGKAVLDIKKAKIALVTSGGIVPKGNPDRIESSSASKYGKYSIKEFDTLTKDTHETAHGGYDPVCANDDPNRVVPVDVLREMEGNEIGSLFEYFYTTVGNGTSVASSKAYATEFAKELVEASVDAVILTST